jgi:hypothetical protein
MCDKLVFDLSQEVEGSPNVFIRKDWINILDNQNQSYQNNQSIIDTSQLSNSNKYMSYREAYLAVPLLLSLSTPAYNANPSIFVPSQDAADTRIYGRSDYSIGLKNWFGQIIHSFTLDYNGTTIVQQTPFCNMWNTFKLLTTLSYNDIVTQGAIIGFYPDTASSWNYLIPNGNIYSTGANGAATANLAPTQIGISAGGIYTTNNDLCVLKSDISSILSSNGNRLIEDTTLSQLGVDANYSLNTGGNYGAAIRTSWINYNPAVQCSSSTTYQQCGITATNSSIVWKSYISKQVNSGAAQSGIQQISVMATIYLKHVHSFFNMIPLLKGVFMKMTMNLNNAQSTVTLAGAYTTGAVGGNNATATYISEYTSTVPVGGVNPLLVPSPATGSYKAYSTITSGPTVAPAGVFPLTERNIGVYYYNLSVGSKLIGTPPASYVGANGFVDGTLAKSIYLYVPAYTFNPVFEEAYLSNPVKQIKYTDIYQYQVQKITPDQQFNNLITNGIANIKSVLIIPFFSYGANSQTIITQLNGANVNNVLSQPTPVYQSPFDTAGCGTTSPMVTLGNFNVQISGQNAIYNTQRYTFEEFNNQLYGQFAVNGGLTDGLTSGLIGFEEFKQSYCYYYVNVERMLPVEQSVPKSVQIIGTNYSTQTIDMWVFIEYGVEINIDLTTGARV